LDNVISSAVSKVSGKHNPSTSTTKEDEPPVAKKPQQSGRTPKGSNDPIQLHNRYGSLMEADDIHTSPTKSGATNIQEKPTLGGTRTRPSKPKLSLDDVMEVGETPNAPSQIPVSRVTTRSSSPGAKNKSSRGTRVPIKPP